MKFFIELRREQHTTVEIVADTLDEAMKQAKKNYDNGRYDRETWWDYEDSLELTDATEYNRT